jgi:tetratricopeptide (TPR) repeat protein
MILRVSNSVMRGALVAAAFFFLLWLSLLSIRTAWATHERDLGTGEGLERAAKLEPGDARNWFLLGRFLQYNLEQQDSGRAIAAYNRALSIDPGSADTLLELGTAYELKGDLASARTAYARAKAVYPASADAAWRYGNFLLRQGDLQPAYTEIRRAVQADPNRAVEAFSRCYRVNPDPELILKEVLPPSGIGYVEVIRDIAGAQTDIAMKVWTRLAALHPHLFPRDVYPLVNALLQQQQRLAEARRVWNEGMSFTDEGSAVFDSGALLWDGGFESGLSDGYFAWKFDSLHAGVQTSFDSREKHSGSRSLKLGFGGKHNVNLQNTCTIAVVEPGKTYLLSGWIQTDKLSSDHGVGLRISAPGSDLVKTRDIRGSTPWTLVEAKWTAGSDAHLAQICISRDPSEQMEDRIQGTAWVDDVSLAPAAAEKARP